MATIYRGSGRRGIEYIAAMHVDTQHELETRAWEIALRAEANLLAHKADGHAEILLLHGDVDYYVALDDSRGLNAALSIEFGRAGWIDPDSGLVIGAMEPLNILHDAANLPRAKRRQPALKPPERKKILRELQKKRRKKVTRLGGSSS